MTNNMQHPIYTPKNRNVSRSVLSPLRKSGGEVAPGPTYETIISTTLTNSLVAGKESGIYGYDNAESSPARGVIANPIFVDGTDTYEIVMWRWLQVNGTGSRFEIWLRGEDQFGGLLVPSIDIFDTAISDGEVLEVANISSSAVAGSDKFRWFWDIPLVESGLDDSESTINIELRRNL